MTIIMVHNPSKAEEGFAVPEGGEILYRGNIATIPGGWSRVSAYDRSFVEAVGVGEASNIRVGSMAHSHGNSTSGSAGSHNHSRGSATTPSHTSNVNEYNYPQNTSVAPSSHTHSVSAGTLSTTGAHTHTIPDTDERIIYPPYYRLYFIRAMAGAIVPINGIIMWDDLTGNIPEGFALCNGNNGTPDLRDRFIYGAYSDSTLNATGGVLTHSHSYSNPTGQSGSHSHTESGYTSTATTGSNQASGFSEASAIQGEHTHDWSLLVSEGNHTHTIPNTESGSHVPPYYKMFFIMRIE